MDFQVELQSRVAAVENIICGFLPEEKGLQKTVIAAMNYSMQAGGKRIRPLLMQETFRLFGGKGDVIAPFMAAIEMIHNYSLVHDDLPSMDHDEYRRGKKTTHAVFGESVGILAGDALLNYAYETALKAFDIEASSRTARAMKILAEKAGIYGMVGGQLVDIESEGKSVPIETVEFIHRMKCGALIEGAVLIGAVLAGASESEENTAYKIAANIGFAFQIQDDILDVISDEEVLGKPVGSDEENEKSTYVLLKGLDASKAEVKRLTDEALVLLDSLPYRNDFLGQLI